MEGCDRRRKLRAAFYLAALPNQLKNTIGSAWIKGNKVCERELPGPGRLQAR
jgi:hypothetical protein